MPTVRSASRACPRAGQGPSKARGRPGLEWGRTRHLSESQLWSVCTRGGKRLSKHVFVRLSQSVAKVAFKLVIPLLRRLHISPQMETYLALDRTPLTLLSVPKALLDV